MSLHQAATAIPPHAYAYYAPSVAPTMVRPAQQPTAQPTAQVPVQPHLGMEVEWNAFLGDTDAILTVLRAALSTDTATKNRAIKVLKIIPRDALQAVAQALKG